MAKIYRIVLTAIVPLMVLLPNYGCGPYSFSGSTLKGVKSIAVPLFDNQTTQYGIREELTDQLTDALITDNTLKVVNVRNSDSVLKGIVVKYERECYTFDGSGNCSDYISRVFVDVSFEDLKNKKMLWEEKNIEGYGIFSAVDETEDDGIARAIEKLSSDIVDKIIKGW